MKKKLLVLAVATALPMGAAQAGVTVYGKIHASIDYVNPSNYNVLVIPDVCAVPLSTEDYVCPAESVRVKVDDVWDVESRASRIGFKGSEDLGNGLKLIWKVESQINVADRVGDYWKARNTYIGLAGGWGTFLYGRHDTPMKMSTGRLDLFSDELADYNATAGFVDRRADDAIAYVSPSWSGFTFAGAIIPDGDYDKGGDLAGGYSLAAMYTLNSLYFSAAYEDITDLANDFSYDAPDNKIWRLGFGWDIGNFFIGGVYEDEDRLGESDDIKKYQISGSYAFGNSKVKAMWSDHDIDTDGSFWEDAIDNADGSSWAVGYDYAFSKRSKMYAQYADSDRLLASSNSSPTGARGFSMGMVHKF